MALASWYGPGGRRARIVMLGAMIAIECMLGALFALISLQAPLGIPAWAIVAAPRCFLVPLVIVLARKMGEPSDPMDATPNKCWKAGIIYYNPNDPVLFVEKREGFGYTFNFANPRSWMLLLGLALVLASAPFVIA